MNPRCTDRRRWRPASSRIRTRLRWKPAARWQPATWGKNARGTPPARLTSACTGAEPHRSFAFSSSRTTTWTTPTLLVRFPDGSWACNDDRRRAHPESYGGVPRSVARAVRHLGGHRVRRQDPAGYASRHRGGSRTYICRAHRRWGRRAGPHGGAGLRLGGATGGIHPQSRPNGRPGRRLGRTPPTSAGTASGTPPPLPMFA